MTGDVGAIQTLTGQLALTCSPLSGALVSMGSAILSHGLAAVVDAPIQTGSGGAVTERAASAVTERAPIQTGSGGGVAELAASAVTEAICNAGAELTPALAGVPAAADAETVTGDAHDGGVSGGGREKEHQQDEAAVLAAQQQREFMLNWCPPFRKVSGLPRNNPDFDRLFVEAREKSVWPVVGRPGWQRR